MSEVIVSVCCLAYNHEQYIRKCLDGFVMQKCNFKFEVLIHDDASTDKTASIIREYEAKYPNIIKPIYQLENQHSKGIKPTFTYNLPRCKGKYIAFCEGDDYWTSENKLQQQVNLLDQYNNRSGCFHLATIDNITTGTKTPNYGLAMPKIVTQKDMYIYGNHIPTVSMMLRKDAFPSEFPKWFFCAPYADMALYHILLNNSTFERINEHWAVYNLSGTGVFSSNTKKQQNINELKSFMVPISRMEGIRYLLTATYFRKLALQNISSFLNLLFFKR